MDKLDMILQKLDSFDVRFERLETRMDKSDIRFERLEARMDGTDARFERLEQKMQEMKDSLEGKIQKLQETTDGLEGKVEKLQETTGSLEGKVQKLDSKLDSINLRIENEVLRAVHIIAEGHIDLKRHLDEAQADRRERESILLRILNLEYEVKEIKKDRCALPDINAKDKRCKRQKAKDKR